MTRGSNWLFFDTGRRIERADHTTWLVRQLLSSQEDDVEHMQESIDQGWEPPPLLAEYQDGRLLLQDGNHRYEALAREREREAWVLVFFNDPVERDAFVSIRCRGA